MGTPGGLQQDHQVVRRARGPVPVGLRDRQRVHDDHDDALDLVEPGRPPQRARGLELLERLEHAAHAEIVGEAAVDHVQVRAVRAVLEGFQLLHPLQRAPRRARPRVVVAHRLRPAGQLPAARPAVVVERDRRQHERHRGRRGGGARQRHRVHVGAEEVEVGLREREPGAGGDVGRRGDDQRPVAAVEVAERRAAEQVLVVHLGGHLGPAPAFGPQRRPVLRAQEPGQQLALHVALEEPLLVDVEQLVAVQAVRERGEAAARHAGDHVDFVQQAHLHALRIDDLGAPQLLEHAVRERRRAGPASRERQDDEVLLVVVAELPRLEAVAAVAVDFRDGRVDRARGAAGEHDCAEQERERQRSEAEHEQRPLGKGGDRLPHYRIWPGGRLGGGQRRGSLAGPGQRACHPPSDVGGIG